MIKRIVFLVALLQPLVGFGAPVDAIPPERFQGVWEVTQEFFRTIREDATDLELVGEESAKGSFPPRVEIRFRRHESGALQQVWTGEKGEVVASRGITVLEITKNTVTFRLWRDHPTWTRIITLKPDGTALLQERSLKHLTTSVLRKNPERGENK